MKPLLPTLPLGPLGNWHAASLASITAVLLKLLLTLLLTLLLGLGVGLVWANSVYAHGDTASPGDIGTEHAEAIYIANEGVMVAAGKTKILFDPLFHNAYGQYRLPSEEMRAAMMAGSPPFDNVDVVFISHAHSDHFDAQDINTYLATHQTAALVAPAQAVAMMRLADNWVDAHAARISDTLLDFGDPAIEIKVGGLSITAVRIPHAGWPGRADIHNLVYRVTLREGATVIHMGDADPRDDHYAPYEETWSTRSADMGFPPYWFLGRQESEAILYDRLRMKKAVGVHVPVGVPISLQELKKQGKADYFALPGDARIIEISTESDGK